MARISSGVAFVAALLGILLSVPVFTALAAEPYRLGTLEIDRPWARATPSGARTAAVYFSVRNTGSSADRLIGAASSVAAQAEIHETVRDGDVMRMRPVEGGLVLPPGAAVVLQPGAYHVMLVELNQPLPEGALIPLTLRFATAGAIDVVVRVEAVGAAGPSRQDMGDGMQGIPAMPGGGMPR